jgi:flagellin
MPQIINTNIASLTAQNNLNASQNSLQTAIQRLSSGLRINSAADDAAGLAISQRMLAQINGVNQAVRNAQDGVSLAQTADGALSSISDNLQRIRQLAVQSANSTNSSSDRAALQQEVSQLTSEIDRVATQTQFNGLNLLDGTFTSQQFQVGANSGQTISISSLASARTATLGQGYTASTTATVVSGSSVSTAGKVVINGTDIYQGTTIAADAQQLANAINNRGISGVSATATATTTTGAAAVNATAGDTGTIVINGVATATIAAASGVAATDQLAYMAAINNISAATGVTASDAGSNKIKLSAVDGRNITVAYGVGGTPLSATDTGITAATTYSTVTVTSTNSTALTTSGAIATGGGAGSLTMAASTNAGQSGVSIANTDISSISGANAALTSVDAALTAINSERAQLGAIQNRFQSTVANLQTTGQNLTAAKSRITDTDFAAETANLTRAQILQQAGTAMLAQANALPNSVLTLLKG